MQGFATPGACGQACEDAPEPSSEGLPQPLLSPQGLCMRNVLFGFFSNSSQRLVKTLADWPA